MHIPSSSWLMLGLFLITNRWPPVPVTRTACQARQASAGADDTAGADEAAARTAKPPGTGMARAAGPDPATTATAAAATVTTLSKVLAGRPGVRRIMSVPFRASGQDTP